MARKAGSRVTDIYVATESFATEKFGNVNQGDYVRGGHELLKAYPQWFRHAADVPVRFEVEQATAAPGETR